MAAESYRSHLESVPLFARCDRRQLDQILRVADEITIPAGTTFIREGEVGREMFVIAGGTAKVTRGDAELAAIGRGDFVGELSVLRHAPRNATVSAETQLDVLVLRSNVVEPLLDEIPGLAKALLLDVVERLGPGEVAAGS